jgi:orotidine-5'-phosphate decarboxylase
MSDSVRSSIKGSPIAVALDAPDVATAARWAGEVAPHVSTLKLGLEFYLAAGAAGVRQVRAAAPECRLFLDLKLHDIPSTVAGACRAVADLEPDFLTVHALGGPAMVGAAAEALPEIYVTAVTVLTSMSQADLSAVGLHGTPLDAVLRLAEMAVAAGARALVCSPQEVAAVRAAVGADVVLITPGVRPAGAVLGDQQRVATPEQALADGADLLVVGRPITGAGDRAAAAARLLSNRAI